MNNRPLWLSVLFLVAIFHLLSLSVAGRSICGQSRASGAARSVNMAMLLQVSTRGLVYFSVGSHDPIPACVALAGFSVVDGSAYYWHLQKWRFDSLPVLARVHAFLGLIACMLTATFLWWSERFSFTAS